MTITTPETVERNWGTETTIVWTPTHAGKILRRKAGTQGGFQLHVKEESHYVLEGRVRLRWIDADGDILVKDVLAGEGWTVPPGTVHQEEAMTDAVIIEVSDPTTDDRYGIMPDPGGLPSMTSQDANMKLALLARLFQMRAERCMALGDRIGRHGLDSLVPQAVTE